MYLTDTKHRYRFLCFDLDGKTPEAAEAASQDAVALVRLLSDVGLRSVMCQSGPRGGRHVWVALAEHVSAELVHRLARLAKAIYRTLDLSPIMNAAAGCVRPPWCPTPQRRQLDRTRGRTRYLDAPDRHGCRGTGRCATAGTARK